MYLWVDDIRTPPCNDWLWARSVNEAITAIKSYERSFATDTIYISLDHDAGDFVGDGGDYICVLDWLEQAGDCRYWVLFPSSYYESCGKRKHGEDY